MIFDVRSQWITGNPERHEVYEDAPDAETAILQAGRRGTFAGLGTAHGYVGIVAREAVYWVEREDAEVHMDAVFSDAVHRAVDMTIGRGIDEARILIGDEDGPDATVGEVFRSDTSGLLVLFLSSPSLVPSTWRRAEAWTTEIAGHRVEVTGVPGYFAADRAQQARRTFRDQISASPIRSTPESPVVIPVMSLDEAMARRYGAMDLDRARGEARDDDDGPSAASQRFGLLELNPPRRRRRNPDHEGREEAIAKYEEFHRFPPKKIGEFSPMFEIPKVLYRGGKAKWVTYRSDKTDPATGRRPRAPVDYIHEHDAGVEVFLSKGNGESALEKVDVPKKFRDVDALCRLGTSLGYAFEDDAGDEWEAISKAPMPELYTTPDGKCLLVVQSKKTVLAMFWGGALGVFARGIDG